MITSEVTKEQLEEWKKLHELYADCLNPNRINGKQLDEYFREKYNPTDIDSNIFTAAVYQNAAEKSSGSDAAAPQISAYYLEGGIYVGIDLSSGFFQVECEDINKAVPIWDDLFFKRGLSEQDMENFVLTAQYILISEKLS